MRRTGLFALVSLLMLASAGLAHAAPPAQATYNWGGVNADVSSAPATVPEATFVLLATIPINGNRVVVEIQNQSAAMIQLVLDDGAGTAGTVSSILLSPNSGANTAGSIWASSTFKGRVRVYGATGAQVMARQN